MLPAIYGRNTSNYANVDNQQHGFLSRLISVVGRSVSMGVNDLFKCIRHPFIKAFTSMNSSYRYFTV